MPDQNHQYRAFMAVVFAMLVVTLMPLLVSWSLNSKLPDGLINIADKGITAFGTLLGTIGGLMFRQSQVDAARSANDASLIREQSAQLAQTAPVAPPPPADAVEAARQTADAAGQAADRIEDEAR